MSDRRVAAMLREVGLPVKPCGLNADWCVSAWHLSRGEPNVTSGDHYLIDSEEKNEQGDWLFEIVTRSYNDDGDSRIEVLERGKTLAQICEHLRSLAFYAPNSLAFTEQAGTEHRSDPNNCAECARSFGPWYAGECEH